MADVELLPLPPLYIVPSVEPVDYPDVAQALMDYARANVAHATAAKDAEVEALRAEVELLRRGIVPRDDDMIVPVKLLDEINASGAEWKARAERLEEALREIANQGPNHGPDGTYKTWRHWAEIARAALEQEEGRG